MPKLTFLKRFHNKKIQPDILSYDYVSIPEGFQFLKVISYNINIKNTTTLEENISKLIEYIFKDHKDLETDIYCLQGIYDLPSLYKLLHEINKYKELHQIKLYYAPNLDRKYNSIEKILKKADIKGIGLSDPHIFHTNSDSDKIKYTEKMHRVESKYQNIIISKYPIISTIYAELDDEIEIDNILGIHTVIGANINVNKQIISIYNASLSKDIKHANITNNYARKKEMEALAESIQQNVAKIYKTKYHKTNIHIIVGALNFNNKFCNKLHTYNYINIHKYKNNKTLKWMPSNKHDPDDNYMIITSIENIPKKIDDFLFKKFNIYIIESYFRTEFVKHIPLETIFIIQKHK